jgi:hypothetical protein
MPSARIAVLFLLLAAPVAHAQGDEEAEAKRHRSPTPFYLPRGAFLGAFFKDAATTAQLRVQWQLTVVQEPVDALVLVLEGGLGYGLTHPRNAGRAGTARMTYLYQHTAQLGLAYRGLYPNGFHWGLQVTTGPTFLGARFDTLPRERRIIGSVEGRVQFGWRVASVAYGVSLGLSQPYVYPGRSAAAPYLGGLLLGVFADWR